MHKTFDLSTLKASLYTVHSLENVISSFFNIKFFYYSTSTLIGARNWSIPKKIGVFLVL